MRWFGGGGGTIWTATVLVLGKGEEFRWMVFLDFGNFTGVWDEKILSGLNVVLAKSVKMDLRFRERAEMVELGCKYMNMVMMCLCVSGMGWIGEKVEGQDSHLLNVVMMIPQGHYCTFLLLRMWLFTYVCTSGLALAKLSWSPCLMNMQPFERGCQEQAVISTSSKMDRSLTLILKINTK